MTRVPSFRRRSRRVANSAVASACALGIASRTVRISQYAAVCRIRRFGLASGLRQLVLRGELSLVQLDQVLGLAAGAINRLTPAPMASSANPSNPLSGAIFVPSFLADIIETSRSTRYYHRR